MAEIDKYKIIEEQVRQVAERDASTILKEWEEGLLSTEEALRKFAKVGQDTVKSVSRMGDEFAKLTIASKKYTDTLTQQALKEQNAKKSFFERVGFVNRPAQDQLAVQYSARQMAGGIESILEGRFGSGARQILSTFPKVANFMAGPYFLAIQAVTSGLLKFDEAIAKAKQQVISSTGGVFSPFRQDSIGASLYRLRIGERLKNYGLQGKAAEIMGAAYSSTGLGATLDVEGNISKDLLEQRAINQGAALKYMSSLGISEGSINNLLRISRNLEGQSEIGALATQYRLAERFRRSRYMTEDEGMQQSLALYEQTKSLGINFEWASRTVAKFDKALQLGEVSLSDFAAVTRGLRGADTGRATGIAALIKDVAARNGITLPKEFMESSDLGAGLYLQTREGLSNKNIQRALQLAGLQIQGGMSLESGKYDQARGLQMILQGLYGSSVSPEMALRVQETGNWLDILGGRGGVKPEVAAMQADELHNAAKNLYKEERSVAQAISEGIGSLLTAYKAGILVNINEHQWGALAQMLNPVTGVSASTKATLKGFNALGNGTMEPVGP